MSAYVSLVIQRAMHGRHIVMCDLPCSAIFFQIGS